MRAERFVQNAIERGGRATGADGKEIMRPCLLLDLFVRFCRGCLLRWRR
jgi:hypothetical protein